MQRIALGLSYDGTAYHGWQTQQDLMTVQGVVEHALSNVANHPVSVTCAGRTDAGVHATAQTIHFTTTAVRSDRSWVLGANSNLPNDVSVLWAKPISTDFHARFSATERCYRYLIYNHAIRPGILRNAVGWYYRPLDECLMQQAAQHLVGRHDFSSFRATDCQAHSPVRTIRHINILRMGSLLIIEVRANAFLLHMVRNIVGVLLAIGAGERAPNWTRLVLPARDRTQGGITMAPHGLYLVAVDYPSQFQLPSVPAGPFFLPQTLL